MVAYAIDYKVRGKKNDTTVHYANIDAKDLASAKKKLARKYGYADGRMIQVEKVTVVGYL